MKKLQLPELPFEKIDALTKVQRIIICVATFSVIAAGFYYLVYSPRSKEISKLENEYSEVQAELDQAIIRAGSLARLEQEVKDARVELGKAKELLPDSKEIPRLLENVAGLGKSAGLEFLLFKPEKEVSGQFYAQIPVTVKVTGSYHNTAIFFDKISKLYRIVNVFDIKIQGTDKGNSSVLTTACTAKTYRFVEGSDTKGSDAASKKEKKKKGK